MTDEKLTKLRLRTTITITYFDEHLSSLDAGEFAKQRERDIASRSSLANNILEALDHIRKTKDGGVHITVVPVRKMSHQ